MRNRLVGYQHFLSSPPVHEPSFSPWTFCFITQQKSKSVKPSANFKPQLSLSTKSTIQLNKNTILKLFERKIRRCGSERKISISIFTFSWCSDIYQHSLSVHFQSAHAHGTKVFSSHQKPALARRLVLEVARSEPLWDQLSSR
jgi:hypothetical protein